ncbi:hypothetical protein [Kitasatospora sp. NPDC090308]|uniref:hypothetical protein n=1 Tax=Kitasatospora sp. NPDC090308 TaxID=3364082 RepID=UPI00380AFC91
MKNSFTDEKRRAGLTWAGAAGWLALAMVGTLLWKGTGAFACGSVPGLFLGVFLERERARAALSVAAGAGVMALFLLAALTDPHRALAALIPVLAFISTMLYTLPLLLGAGAGTLLRAQAARRSELDQGGAVSAQVRQEYRHPLS